MPPSRTRDNIKNEEASSKHKTRSKHKQQRNISEQEESTTIPGVQKVKAQLRQTRRLLAKDNLAADVRVETERRLKALEADLQKVELARKEKHFSTRYHKIKFFERQKVSRKLKQAQKRLDASAKKSESEQLSSEVHELRVDLNYILHYPKAKKYISLFPPGVRKGEEVAADSLAESKKSDLEREEVKKWVREQMERGQLPPQPEVELSVHQKSKKAKTQGWPQGDSAGSAKRKSKLESKRKDGVVDDEFFGDDDASS